MLNVYMCGQESVVHIGLHSVRHLYKRRHGLRPLVSVCVSVYSGYLVQFTEHVGSSVFMTVLMSFVFICFSACVF